MHHSYILIRIYLCVCVCVCFHCCCYIIASLSIPVHSHLVNDATISGYVSVQEEGCCISNIRSNEFESVQKCVTNATYIMYLMMIIFIASTRMGWLVLERGKKKNERLAYTCA